MRWSKYCSFSISPSNEYSGLISFRKDWLDLLAVLELSNKNKINRIYVFWRNLLKKDIMENSLIQIKPYEKQSIKC